MMKMVAYLHVSSAERVRVQMQNIDQDKSKKNQVKVEEIGRKITFSGGKKHIDSKNTVLNAEWTSRGSRRNVGQLQRRQHV